MNRTKPFISVISGCLLILAVVMEPVGLLAGESAGNFREEAAGSHFFQVKLPPAYKLDSARRLQYRGGGIVVDLYSRNFAQGDVVYCEIYGDTNTRDEVTVKRLNVEKEDVKVAKKSWGYRGFFALNPEGSAGRMTVTVDYSFGWRNRQVAAAFNSSKADFPFYRTPLDLGKYSDADEQKKPEVRAFIEECVKKKAEAFGSSGDDIVGVSFSHPRDLHHVTSPFWSKRIYMSYTEKNGRRRRLPDNVKIHRGLDLRGAEGSPLFAMADGRVVLAEKLYYEGNMLVLDHGNGMFSYYMHLNSLNVKKGDRVRAGDLVAAVGSTGISTASHLHVSLIIRGVQVDPLSILCLPVRE
jgi:murein DD-endopeptidase MepM/ murein hydrolase activator NlpD